MIIWLIMYGSKGAQKMTSDTSCLKCGYELKATAENDSCPECGSKEGAGNIFDVTLLSRMPGWAFALWSATIILISVTFLAANTIKLIYE